MFGCWSLNAFKIVVESDSILFTFLLSLHQKQTKKINKTKNRKNNPNWNSQSSRMCKHHWTTEMIIVLHQNDSVFNLLLALFGINAWHSKRQNCLFSLLILFFFLHCSENGTFVCFNHVLSIGFIVIATISEKQLQCAL